MIRKLDFRMAEWAGYNLIVIGDQGEFVEYGADVDPQ